MVATTERRKSVRVCPLDEDPVIVHLMGSALIDVLKAHDISMGGIGILAPHHFDEWDLHEKIEIIVALPGDLADFRARGIIKQIGKKSKEYGLYGVQFTEIGPKGKQDLLVFINRLIRKKRALK